MSATDAPDWQRVVTTVKAAGDVPDAPDWQRVVVAPGGKPVGGGGASTDTYWSQTIPGSFALSPGQSTNIQLFTVLAPTTVLVELTMNLYTDLTAGQYYAQGLPLATGSNYTEEEGTSYLSTAVQVSGETVAAFLTVYVAAVYVITSGGSVDFGMTLQNHAQSAGNINYSQAGSGVSNWVGRATYPVTYTRR